VIYTVYTFISPRR